MNAYRFYSNGELYTTCWSNEVAENHISACLDLSKKGLTPYYYHNPDTDKYVLTYTDSFKIEKVFRDHAGNYTSRVVTPENVDILCKSMQRKLAKFQYNGKEWKAN